MEINSSSTKSWIVALTHLHVFFVWLFVTPSVYFSISNFASVFLHISEQTDTFSVSCLSPLVSFSSFGKLCWLFCLCFKQIFRDNRRIVIMCLCFEHPEATLVALHIKTHVAELNWICFTTFSPAVCNFPVAHLEM